MISEMKIHFFIHILNIAHFSIMAWNWKELKKTWLYGESPFFQGLFIPTFIQ